MSTPRIMLYGATGFTAGLIIKEAKAQNIPLTLAGRDPTKMGALGKLHGLPVSVFSLAEKVGPYLRDYDVVIHAAGPFSETYVPMLEGCIQAGTHYLDITGEMEVFEGIFARSAQIRDAGIAAIPGVGFDVVPTDCLAARLAAALPGATHLELAFAPVGAAVSRGTTRTMVTHMHKGGAIRQDGKIVKVTQAFRTREIPFRGGTKTAVTIPWGDVSTAYHSTQIANIMVYMALLPKQIRGMRLSRPFVPLLHIRPLRNWLRDKAGAKAKGPSEAAQADAKVELWGEV